MNYQLKIEDLFSHACLAASYSFLARGGKFNWVNTTQDILDGIKKGYIEDDGFVSKPVHYLEMMGMNAKDIKKVYISSLLELPDNGIYVVEYKKAPHATASHFVVVENKQVIFDPSEPSNTVKYGAPYSYREIV